MATPTSTETTAVINSGIINEWFNTKRPTRVVPVLSKAMAANWVPPTGRNCTPPIAGVMPMSRLGAMFRLRPRGWNQAKEDQRRLPDEFQQFDAAEDEQHGRGQRQTDDGDQNEIADGDHIR